VLVGGDVTGGNSCAKTTTRTWRAIDACGNSSVTRSQTVTQVDTQAPTIGQAGANATINCTATPVFTAPTASDACNTVTVILVSDVTTAGVIPGSFTETRTWRAVDACGNSSVTRSQTIVVECQVTVCTLTQGAYGNPGGNICLPNGTTVNQTQIMINALTAAPGNVKVFGRQDLNRYWVLRLSDVNQGSNSNIFKMLPGGGPSKVFGLDTYAGVPEYQNHPTWPVAPLQPGGPTAGKIRNILFAQTMTLYFNTTIAGSGLGNMPLGPGQLVIADRNCGSQSPVPGTNDTVSFMGYTAIAYIVNPANGYPATVQGLLQLANDKLGGVALPGVSLDQINDAVDAINEGFDECRMWVGYIAPNGGRMLVNSDAYKPENKSPEQALSVTAYPNPYNDQVRFVIESSISGQGSLDVYNMLGQKLQTVFTGFIMAGKGQAIEYKVPVQNRENLVYILRVKDKQVTGKLIRID